ncbi:MAG: chemotaxis response regulator protein-glutamate methylesterase [Gammaproteobacteria bacterium]|nr:MAG: chemotaxis response regulator protein-glutamate methylesterase [Gammaproteobacteria bacterium]
MTIKVLVVDDSGFFRRRIKTVLEQDSEIKVIGEAANGEEAVAKVKELRPDVVSMDVQMPVMDGITAVREIMKSQPTPCLMFSTLTYEGAQATLDALEAGAVDFLPKKFEDINKDTEEGGKVLQERVKIIGKRGLRLAHNRTKDHVVADSKKVAATTHSTKESATVKLNRYNLVIIGTSTGGPVALQKVLTSLPSSIPCPIVLVQHMPPKFTTAFAERMNTLCRIEVKEAADGDVLKPGVAFLAPGGRQLGLKKAGADMVVEIFDAGPEQIYKPCVDTSFEAAADVCPGKTLGIILTGMGRDGAKGAKKLKSTGATIWAQDEESSLIYGMPAAVAKLGLADKILGLDAIANDLARG